MSNKSPKPSKADSFSFPYKIPILYEDADCAVINKPAGLMVHSDGRNEGPFLTDWVVSKYPEAANVGDPMTGPDGAILNRAGIVHRLDKETSGALIVARTAKGHESLKKQFKDREIKKKYLAFVWGELKEEFGTIDRPIGKSSSDFRRWSAQRGARGEMREAETYWTRIWTGKVGEEKFTLVAVEPKTGRTHQIRVHMTAIQHPVVSDPLYAETKPKVLGFERVALHSLTLEFMNTSNKAVRIFAPLPSDFENATKECGIPLETLESL